MELIHQLQDEHHDTFHCIVQKLLSVVVSTLLSTSLVIGKLVQAGTFELTTATIEDINAAFDAGALNSEKLVELSLARIKAYDTAGPNLNGVIIVNPQALDRARDLDAERQRTGRRSPLHGVPVVLKDNIDTADMPTTAGSFMLRDSVPPDDAYVVQKLRKAGAIILAKVNMSEFAAGAAISSLAGLMRNPHNPARSPGWSSGGTGIAIAATYAQVGLGTDTGGSIRVPSSANGIVGLKTTHGLVSLDGVVPSALSFDVVGPMARSVYDVAVALSVITGVDPANKATRKSKDKFRKDYTKYLDATALKGTRIGVARDFMGQDVDVDWVVEASLAAMKSAGATVVDVNFPNWFINSHIEWHLTIARREFRDHIPDYLATLHGHYPKSLNDLVERSMRLTARDMDGMTPNPSRWMLFKQYQDETGDDYHYKVLTQHALPLARNVIEGIISMEKLDAIIYPTLPIRPWLIESDPYPVRISKSAFKFPLLLANLTGFPDLIVPAGFTSSGLPVTLSFLGTAFTESKLLALGYAFEKQMKAHRQPITTPTLPGEKIEY